MQNWKCISATYAFKVCEEGRIFHNGFKHGHKSELSEKNSMTTLRMQMFACGIVFNTIAVCAQHKNHQSWVFLLHKVTSAAALWMIDDGCRWCHYAECQQSSCLSNNGFLLCQFWMCISCVDTCAELGAWRWNSTCVVCLHVSLVLCVVFLC